jgi:hypothetical protein
MKNAMVKEMINLHKEGKKVLITEDGWRELVKLIGADFNEEMIEENVG